MSKTTKIALVIGAFILLFTQFTIQLRLAKLDSQTTDEGVHISAGYTYLTTGDFRFNPEHPPLAKELAAVPLLFLHLNTSSEMQTYWNRSSIFFYDNWMENRDYGEAFLYKAGNNPDQILFWARLPIVIITFLLGLTIFLIVRKHWGELAAFMAVAFYAFDPTIAAHGHLVTTDVPLALTFLLAMYSGWLFLSKPSWKKAAIAGLCLGLTLLTKHTAVIALPALLVLMVLARFVYKQPNYWKTVIPQTLGALLVTFFVIWAGFGFHDRVLPATSSVTQTSIDVQATADQVAGRANSNTAQQISSVDHAYSLLRPVLTLFPGDYLKGLFLLFHHVGTGQGSYLLGQTSITGWWYYFPVVFGAKTPIPTLAMIALALYVLYKTRPRDWPPIALAMAATVYLLSAMSSKANLGVRHIMPMYPLLFIVCGWAVGKMNQSLRYVSYGLLAMLVVLFSLSFPTYLGYFNQLVGGSTNGYKIATDSNLDWGQDLHRIATYITDNNIQHPYIEYGWDGVSALDYYLGKGTWQQLSNWQTGQVGTAIIGASAYNNAQYQYLRENSSCHQITSGTFACTLK